MDTKALSALSLALSVFVVGWSQAALASPGGQLLIVSIDITDPTTVSLIVAVPTPLAVEPIPPSAFSVVVGDHVVELTSTEPLSPQDLAVGLVIDDSDGVAPDLLGQQQSALVDLVRRLEPGTVASVGTTSGLLLAPPSTDKATMIRGIASAKPTDAAANAGGPPGLFEGDTSRRQIVAIDVEPRSPQPDVTVTNAIGSVVRLHRSGHATIETRPSAAMAFVPAGPSTLLVAVDLVGASLIHQYRLTGRVPVPTEGTVSVSLTLGFGYLSGKAPLPLAPPPTAGPTDPPPSPVVMAPATTPASPVPTAVAPSAPATSAPSPPSVTAATAAPAPSQEAAESQEVALPLQTRGSGRAIPIRTLASVGALLAAVAAVGVMVFQRARRQERVYVRVSAPYRHPSRPSHSATRSRAARSPHEQRPRSRSG